MIKQDTSENQANLIYLAIGSNLGDKRNNIEKAKFKLMENDITIIKSSSFYQSNSWPNPNNPNFLNIVLNIATNLEPLKLLEICKKIEISLGRTKSAKNSPRICDIDIIDYSKRRLSGNLILPHPRMHRRNFVLIPLFELNKHWTHSISKKDIKSLILSLSNSDMRSIKKI